MDVFICFLQYVGTEHFRYCKFAVVVGSTSLLCFGKTPVADVAKQSL